MAKQQQQQHQHQLCVHIITFVKNDYAFARQKKNIFTFTRQANQKKKTITCPPKTEIQPQENEKKNNQRNSLRTVHCKCDTHFLCYFFFNRFIFFFSVLHTQSSCHRYRVISFVSHMIFYFFWSRRFNQQWIQTHFFHYCKFFLGRWTLH